MVEKLFFLCVGILETIGEVTGLGYFAANLLIFVIIQPGLILLFFALWQRERRLKSRLVNE